MELKTIQNKKVDWVEVIAFLLILPAFFINLGLLPVLTDEPTRTLVAFEMMHEGNYFVPTIGGELYFNKPPLYNLILVGLFKLFNSYSTWLVRLPMVLSLFGFATHTYIVLKKEVNREVAKWSAFGILITGRILFYDSLLGLIDITFSWLIFYQIYCIIKSIREEKYTKLFIVTYLLTSIGFLMKGLPSIVFQGFSLLAVFIYYKKFLKLFHPAHFIGFMIMVVIFEGYFLGWVSYSGEELGIYLKTLWSESSKRTASAHGIGKSIGHLFSFPLEFVFHFAPLSLLVIASVKKKWWTKLKQQSEFLHLSFWLIVANLLVYWISPDTRPRYLFMFLPFFFAIIIHDYTETTALVKKVIHYIFLSILIASLALPIVSLFNWQTNHVKGVEIICTVWIFLIVLVVLKYWKRIGQLQYLIIGMLIIRIGFNMVVLPARYKHEPVAKISRMAKRVAEITKGEPLYIHRWTPLNHDLIWNISSLRNQPLTTNWEMIGRKGVFYIVDDVHLQRHKYKVYYEFETTYHKTHLNLVKRTH